MPPVRNTLIGIIIALIVIEIVFLSPANLEQGDSDGEEQALDPDVLISTMVDKGPVLAPGIPSDKIPDYTIEQFDYLSTQGAEKQWKIIADQAFLYNKERLVHSRRVRALLFNPDNDATLVTGNEAKYFMNQRTLEIFGNVVTTFPDGFVLNSEYMKYEPTIRKIHIPKQYFVKGGGSPGQKEKELDFTSMGLDFSMNQNEVILPHSAHVIMTRNRESGAETTHIRSDRCVIYRDQQIAKFTMDPHRPLKTRFVKVTQPDLFVRSRRVELNYGDFDNILNYMVAYNDVFIREMDEKNEQLRYGTCGQAFFNAKSDIIRLTQYPQVYQDQDTVTGEVITIHRRTDIVEVEKSNAYSQGDE